MNTVKKRMVWVVAILILLLFTCRILPAALEAFNAAIITWDAEGAGRATGEFFRGAIMWVLELF